MKRLTGSPRKKKKPCGLIPQGFFLVRSTGLEPVPVAGHAPQTCAYADSATTADEQMNYTARQILCQGLNPIDG